MVHKHSHDHNHNHTPKNFDRAFAIIEIMNRPGVIQ